MARELISTRWSSRNPFRFSGADLPMPLLLVAKLLAVCILFRFIWRDLPDPFLPFWPVFDLFRGTPYFGWALRGAVLTGAVAVLVNYRVRNACLVIGFALLMGILSSRIYFQSNRTFLGCVFFLLGLYGHRTGPWLIRAQMMLVFFSAGLNKLLDASWRSGKFFEFWSHTFVNKSFYFHVAAALPPMFMSRFMSWTTIAIEFSIALGLLFRRTRLLAIWTGLLLSLGLNVLTERTFGVFFYAMPICYLTFALWPSTVRVLYDGDCEFFARLRNWAERLDLEKMFVWEPFQQAGEIHGYSQGAVGDGLYAEANGKKYSGFRAFRIMLLYNPLTYFFMLAALMLPQEAYFRHRSVVAVLFAVFFSPLFVPVGEAAFGAIARNRRRILSGESQVISPPAPTSNPARSIGRH